jgi:predicted Zn finger-like uncharacterized protein
MNGAASTRAETPGSLYSVFTQCSKCETIFKLSAEVLRAAGGQVRCGKCGEVFNALARLAEDANTFTSSETEFELESRADSILETPPAPASARRAPDIGEDSLPPGVEIARLQILDWSEDELPSVPAPARSETRGAGDDEGAAGDERAGGDEGAANAGDSGEIDLGGIDIGETSLEYTLPPGELDRIFVESKTQRRQMPRNLSVDFDLSEPEPHPEDPAEASDIIAPAPSGFEVPEDVRREMLTGFDPAETLAPRSALADRRFMPWLAASIAAALLLLAQIVHHNREWFAAHAPFGTSLGALYGALGAAVSPPENLAAYQLRQWGVTGDPAADGSLRVRASIMNTAAQLEPYPLLRVTLANRFGSMVGTRDFEPSEYLGKPTAKLLAPGERVDATMDILDPGKSAEGFEIDVCLRAADKRVACANDSATKP